MKGSGERSPVTGEAPAESRGKLTNTRRSELAVIGAIDSWLLAIGCGDVCKLDGGQAADRDVIEVRSWTFGEFGLLLGIERMPEKIGTEKNPSM